MRLNHVTLRVSDLERSVAFYKRLGFIQLVAAQGYARFQCPAGEATLSLEGRGCEGPIESPAVSIHFESDSLDVLVADRGRRASSSSRIPPTSHTCGGKPYSVIRTDTSSSSITPGPTG